MLGAHGTAIIFLHTLISFCVAQFQSLVLTWLCSLLLLSTLRLQDVEEVKVSVAVLPLGRRSCLWQCFHWVDDLCLSQESIEEPWWGSPWWSCGVDTCESWCVAFCSLVFWIYVLALSGCPRLTLYLFSQFGRHGWCQMLQKQRARNDGKRKQ